MELRDGLYLANIITNIVLWVLFWRERRSDRHAARFTALEGRVDRLGQDLRGEFESRFDTQADRLTHLETQGSAAPTHADLAELHEKINGIGADMATLAGEFRGVRALLDTIHQHLLNK